MTARRAPRATIWEFTVRTPPGTTASDVVEVYHLAGRGHRRREEVVFHGYSRYQAHCVAQALAHYHQYGHPPQPIQESYPAMLPEWYGVPSPTLGCQRGGLWLVL